MIIGSIKENLSLEKRVSITPETAKNIINLGLKICIEKDYATHIGLEDSEYKNVGVDIKSSSKEVFNHCDLLLKVNCPSDEEIINLKAKTILIGMLNPSKNKDKFREIIKKKYKYLFVRVATKNNSSTINGRLVFSIKLSRLQISSGLNF